MSTRREARRRVMQALYAHEQGSGSADHVVRTLVVPEFEDDPQTREFAEQLFRATVDVMDEADEVIRAHATNWDLSRITAVDRALLRMATAEFLAFEEIPPKVSIDEAIEVAKTYSTDDSGPFINGVLDAVLMDLHRQDRLDKSGRGLVGMESIRERAESD
jgi:N utilization substance protein B